MYPWTGIRGRGGGIMSADLTVDLGFVTLSNPVILASGTAGHADELAPYMDLSIPGAIITKGISLRPRTGNPAPRIWETSSGLINSIGLENPGIDVFLRSLPSLVSKASVVGVNIFGETVSEYADLARRLNEVDGISFIEVNVSCPNVEKGGEHFGHNPDLVREITHLCRQAAPSKGIVVKVPPIIGGMDVCEAALDSGADAITVSNTIPAADVDLSSGRMVPGTAGRGGLSGPAVFPITVNAVRQVRQAFPGAKILASGGAAGSKDVLKLIMAGADAVQIGTVTFLDPAAGERIVGELPELVERLGIDSMSAARGSAIPA